jgi:hypothetical protein
MYIEAIPDFEISKADIMSIALGRRGVRVAGLVTGGAATNAALAVIGPEPKEEVIKPRGNGMLVHLAGTSHFDFEVGSGAVGGQGTMLATTGIVVSTTGGRIPDLEYIGASGSIPMSFSS